MGRKQSRLSKGAILLAAFTVLIAVSLVGIANAEKPIKIQAGGLELIVNGGFSPKTLSKKTLTPIAFFASGQIKEADGTHPPALKEVLIEADKNSAVSTVGFPTCKGGELQSRTTAEAEAVCGDALIGTGTTNVSIAFPESPPVPVHSKLLVFNGGTSGGVTTFYIHAYITVPVPAAIVTTVKITKIHNGRYGMLSVATIPKIAGGSGSVTSFSLTINKKYTYKGRRRSVISAKCVDGKLQVHAEALFSDGTKAAATVVRTCTPKG
jgi:hypothetical protein